MTLLLAAPAAGTTVTRDVVIDEGSVAAARISAATTTARYPIGDGSGATIAVAVTASCQAYCGAADPQRIASFVGTLIHGPEVSLLTVQLDTPAELELDCGLGAQACYYPDEDKVVLSGDEAPSSDGASRDFVLAHEYGHHLANHRQSVAPFPAAIDWGTPRWSSQERICQARRRGAVFPGDEEAHYDRNPGEAFAEAFARYRFPGSDVRWGWAPELRPDAAAFEAIREDTLNPWQGRTTVRLAGHAWSTRRSELVRSFRTPLDGTVSVEPPGGFARRFRLSLAGPDGRRLRTSQRRHGARRQLNFTVCGQSRLRVRLGPTGGLRSPLPLLVQRP
jgi:hypothetical protein